MRRAQLASPARPHPHGAGTFPQVLYDDLLTDARVALRTTDVAPRRLLHVEEEVSPPPLTPTPIPPQVPVAEDLRDRHGRRLQHRDHGERLPTAQDPTHPSNSLTGPDVPCMDRRELVVAAAAAVGMPLLCRSRQHACSEAGARERA